MAGWIVCGLLGGNVSVEVVDSDTIFFFLFFLWKKPLAEHLSLLKKVVGIFYLPSKLVKICVFSPNPVSKGGSQFMAGYAQGGNMVALNFLT